MNEAQEMDRIVEWMRMHKIDPVCPVCGGCRWKRGGGYRWMKLPGVQQARVRPRQPDNSVTPRTYVICEGCAHVRVFPKLRMDF